jgi:hypothetical protein
VAVAGSTDVGSFIARLRPGGRPDKAMGPGGVKTLHDNENLVDVAALPDGRILAAGSSGTRDVLYRLTGDLKPPSCAGKKATIVGTHAADTLVGTAHPDVITGRGGKDTITGLGKGDIICGGPGGDTLRGGPGPRPPDRRTRTRQTTRRPRTRHPQAVSESRPLPTSSPAPTSLRLRGDTESTTC